MAIENEPVAPASAVEDVAAPRAATADFFTAEVNRRQDEVYRAQQTVAEAEGRRGEIAYGARMTVGECVAVHASVQAPVFELTRAVFRFPIRCAELGDRRRRRERSVR